VKPPFLWVDCHPPRKSAAVRKEKIVSKVNLALPSVQIREIRINSITGYHGDAEDLVAASACGLKDRLSQNDAQVFHGVVIVHFDIPFGFDVKVKKTVTGKKGQHMVEKGDPGVDGRFAAAVKFQTDSDIGFTGGTADLCITAHRGCLLYFPGKKFFFRERVNDHLFST
jgi:hypothetical protein